MASLISLGKISFVVDATPDEVMRLDGGFFRLKRGHEVAVFGSHRVVCVSTYANFGGNPWQIERYERGEGRC